MTKAAAKPHKTELGDFQTPRELARDCCRIVARVCPAPRALFEPNCGRGNFLAAGIEVFPSVVELIGLELQPVYANEARSTLGSENIQIYERNCFDPGALNDLNDLADPVLVLGNPPWVTAADLTRMNSVNSPLRSGTGMTRGFESLTGESNFDVAEWVIWECLQRLQNRNGVLAMLCKTNVAYRILARLSADSISTIRIEIRRIDAQHWFEAAVDACLFLVQLSSKIQSPDCDVYNSLDDRVPQRTIGMRDGSLVHDLTAYDRWRHCLATRKVGWRSGIKHDCSAVFELEPKTGGYRTLTDDFVALEDAVVFPLLKSSDLANSDALHPRKFLLVPQRRINESPEAIALGCPLAWDYLRQHQARLQQRKSRIYRDRHPYSVFGVGDYTFTPWKVAISGLYKSPRFRVIGPWNGRPVVFDDTCYVLPCPNADTAQSIVQVLESPPAQELLAALVDPFAKRPYTAKVLDLLDLTALAREAGIELPKDWHQMMEGTQNPQRRLF